MESDHPEYKIIAAAAIGALGGLLLARYLFDAKNRGNPLSKHVASLSKIIEQLESVNDVDVENLKERIEKILTTIEKNYGNPEE